MLIISLITIVVQITRCFKYFVTMHSYIFYLSVALMAVVCFCLFVCCLLFVVFVVFSFICCCWCIAVEYRTITNTGIPVSQPVISTDFPRTSTDFVVSFL